jgi:anti-sigma regulatory factor (Ser/Thr protein kinase)
VAGTTAWVSQVPLQGVDLQVLTHVGDLGYAGRYVLDGGTDEPIGGDFYDVLDLGEDLIALCVGDVAGHGPQVMPQMQALRGAVRDTALGMEGPAAVVAALDVYWEGLGLETLATLWYGEYRPSTGELVYVSAGHPPPVLTVHGDPARLLQAASVPPLGVGVAREHALAQTETLPHGAVLVAYSDGLVERRRTDIEEQIADLQRVVTAACDPTSAADAHQIADRILDALVPDPDRAEDDVCLLVVVRRAPAPAANAKAHADRSRGSGVGPSTAGRDGGDRAPRPVADVHVSEGHAVLALAEGPAGLSAARSEARQVCQDHGVGKDRADAVELVLSELLGNACRHGHDPISYRTGLDHDDVLVTVYDGAPSPPVQSADVGWDAEGGRGLLLVSSMSRSWGWDPTASGKQVWARV